MIYMLAVWGNEEHNLVIDLIYKRSNGSDVRWKAFQTRAPYCSKNSLSEKSG